MMALTVWPAVVARRLTVPLLEDDTCTFAEGEWEIGARIAVDGIGTPPPRLRRELLLHGCLHAARVRCVRVPGRSEWRVHEERGWTCVCATAA